MDKIRLGIVGLGNWGINHLRTFAQLPECEIRAIADLIDENLKKGEKITPQAKSTADYSLVTESKEIDAVVVATSAESHYTVAKSALGNGKDVLVEKPMALLVNEAEELVRLAKTNDRILMVGHLLLYHPAVQKLKEYSEMGILGDILYIRSTRINLQINQHWENALWGFAPHDISVMLYLLNTTPDKVQAVDRYDDEENLFSTVFFTLNFPENIVAQGEVGFSNQHKIRKITIVGTKKIVIFNDVEPRDKIKIYDNRTSRINPDATKLHLTSFHSPIIDEVEPLQVEAAFFLNCIRKRRIPLTDGRQGLEIVKILEGLQKSLDNRGITVRLSD